MAPLSVTTGSLPGGTVGTAYSATLAASGGSGTKTWSLASGSLPAELSLSGGEVISGTPTAAATSSFTVRVSDSTGQAERSLSIAVTGGSGGGGGGSSFEVGAGAFSAPAAGGSQANLNASFSSGRLVLTPAAGNQCGSAFRTGKVGISQFWTEFTFQVS